jgi:hypothetical protein
MHTGSALCRTLRVQTLLPTTTTTSASASTTTATTTATTIGIRLVLNYISVIQEAIEILTIASQLLQHGITPSARFRSIASVAPMTQTHGHIVPTTATTVVVAVVVTVLVVVVGVFIIVMVVVTVDKSSWIRGWTDVNAKRDLAEAVRRFWRFYARLKEFALGACLLEYAIVDDEDDEEWNVEA